MKRAELASAYAGTTLLQWASQSRTDVSEFRIVSKVIDFESVVATFIDCCADGTLQNPSAPENIYSAFSTGWS